MTKRARGNGNRDRGNRSAWISAADAASLLGVSRATLYAYVSRGYVRSEATPGSARVRRYAREDAERLRQRAIDRRDPDKAAARALQWGLPVLESAISFIGEGRLYYRGHDAVTLARTRSLAEVASLIWTGDLDARFASRAPRIAVDVAGDAGLPFVARAQTVLARAGSSDFSAFDLRPVAVARAGWRALHLLVRTAVGSGREAPMLDATLGQFWGLNARGVDVVRAALILCADHELNVSAFTARAVASAGSHPYAVLIAGLSALEGTRHGGATARVETALRSLRHTRNLRHAIAERLRHGDALHGFGHPLYRDGDPRATALLELLQETHARSAELQFVNDVARTTASVTADRPNLDFALAALARVLRLAPGSPLTIFAIGRTIGWIGHAIEQYATGQLIRPRARYVGVVPVGQALAEPRRRS